MQIFRIGRTQLWKLKKGLKAKALTPLTNFQKEGISKGKKIEIIRRWEIKRT
jgi:hypothetical protein